MQMNSRIIHVRPTNFLKRPYKVHRGDDARVKGAMEAELRIPPGADIRSWRTWLQHQQVSADVRDTLDFGLATVESCDFGMVLQATGQTILFNHINQDSAACFGEGFLRVDLPLTSTSCW